MLNHLSKKKNAVSLKSGFVLQLTVLSAAKVNGSEAV